MRLSYWNGSAKDYTVTPAATITIKDSTPRGVEHRRAHRERERGGQRRRSP